MAADPWAQPGPRSSPEDIQRSRTLLAQHGEIELVLERLPYITLVLDENRQVVSANRRLSEDLHLDGLSAALGQRPGELLQCVNSATTQHGCGTAAECRYCYCVLTVLRSQQTGQTESSDCRVRQTSAAGSRSLDLRVQASPLPVGPATFTVLSVLDISADKQRERMERVFFHDLMNTAGAVQGLAEALPSLPPGPDADLLPALREAANQLVEEIRCHRELAQAERGVLGVRLESLEAQALLREATSLLGSNSAMLHGRRLRRDDPPRGLTLRTDRNLARRVLVNMLKNALEATPRGGEVGCGCLLAERRVDFWVHNPTAMQPDVRSQVFQRSFSTKGGGRGIGTYAMKLLMTQYLNGDVRFRSEPEHGTTFFASFPH